MKRYLHTMLPLLLASVVLMSACGAPQAEQAAAPEATAFVAAPVTAVEKETEETKESGTNLTDLPPDPPYDFDIDTMVPSDFGDFFTESYKTETESYSLLAGTSYENEVTVLHGAEDGPTVYVVAGVHGDEEAAWQTGKLLKKAGIKAGTLYILAPANPWGAAKVPKSRYVDGKDMNRSFPGNAGGTNAQRVADAIYKDIADKVPDFVFDLHEAVIVEEGRDYLGSSLIFTSLDGMEDMFMDMYLATQSGEICSEPFSYFEAVSSGSINNAVTTGLRIPVITVETYRGYEMQVRISDQLDIVSYVLSYYGII